MKMLLKRYWLPVIGILLGALGGYLYWRFDRLCDGYVSYYLFSFCQYGLGSSDRRIVCKFIQKRKEI